MEVSATNSIYTVFVEDVSSVNGIGVFAATTGATHPAGPGLDLLAGAGSATFGSYLTVRSSSTNTDYVQSGDPTITSGNTIVALSGFATVTPLGTTGFRTTYVLPGAAATPDALTIVNDVRVNGTTFLDSSVEVTTAITNNGATPVSVSLRRLWDFNIAGDDGPVLQALNPNGSVLTQEADFAAPAFERFQVYDNDFTASPPTYAVFGTVTGPAFVTPVPTPPSRLSFVCWETAFYSAFDYTPSNAVTVASNDASCDTDDSGGDSSVLYFDGPVTIQPGATATFSASIFAADAPAAAAEIPMLSPRGIALLAAVLLLAATWVLRSRVARRS